MNNFDVLVIGRSCLDVIAVVNQFPLENQKLPREFRLTEGGGQGGRASCCISRLSGKVAYVGKLGDDSEGKLCLKRLADFEVTTEFMVAGHLIVTHGEKGAYYAADGTIYQVPVPEVKAVDTVGAGDNFHGAFALALSRGLDLHQAVKFSVAVASLSCREYGGRMGIPTWQQALEVAGTLTERSVRTLSDLKKRNNN